MPDNRMFNPKFGLMLFLLSFMTVFTIFMFSISVAPLSEGDVDALKIIWLFFFLCSLGIDTGIVLILSRSFLIMFDRGDHYVLFGSFPRLFKKITMDEHFQITEREYYYDTGVEEKILRNLALTDGLRTYRVIMLPVKWLHLIERRENRVRKRRVGLGEPLVPPPM